MKRLDLTISLLFKKHIDWIACLLLMLWGWASFKFFFQYETFYLPNSLVIDHYVNLTVFGWVFLIANYSSMKRWGKVTVGGFTAMLLINTYQLHVGFTERWYFIAWISITYIIIFLAYIFYIVKCFRDMFN